MTLAISCVLFQKLQFALLYDTRASILDPCIQGILVKLTKCQTCNVFLLNSRQLIEHKQEHARTKETKDINKKYRLICEFCKEIFPSVTLLREHIHSLHMKPFYEDTENSITTQIIESKKESEESNVIENNDKQKFFNENNCSKCKKTFEFKGSLKMHLKIAHECFKHKCNKCDNEFKSRGSLFNHKKIV